ncbi:MAG TPA: ORF6N domain-containing protein [bacterium]|nr:ORF6N domain-containing protein [bacterium]HPS30348.1 ORF6N domain-containing protein [bacterium]
MDKNELVKLDDIQTRIYTIRGKQVMIDADLAELYKVDTKVLNQAVKRNPDRFPEEYMFTLNETEFLSLRSQIVTSNKRGGRRYFPNVFTEQGVAMLSAVLKSDIAVEISIKVINAFVKMRHFIASNAQIFQRLDAVEAKQIETDSKLEKVLDALENRQIQPQHGIFFDGQIFDAYKFVSEIIRSAEKSIILIDNYVDETVLAQFAKKKPDVSLKILTKNISRELEIDVKKFNEQFPVAEIQKFDKSHDRFLIIDNSIVYLFGASLKDLGRKWFGFSKMEAETTSMISKIMNLQNPRLS